MSVVLSACVALASLAAGLLAVAAWLWTSRRRTSIPGPPTLPLLGNALVFWKLPVPWGRLEELHARYGDVFRLYVGPKLVIVLTQPEDVQSVLVTNKTRHRDPYVGHILRPFMGNGLPTVNGETWKKHRKIIEPAFHTDELKKFMEKFNDGGNFLCKQLAERKGEEVELYHVLVPTSLRTSVATIFDLDLEWIIPGQKLQDEVAHTMIGLIKALSTIACRPWTTIRFIRWMTAAGRALTRVNTVANTMADRGFALASKKLDGITTSDRRIISLLLPHKISGVVVTKKQLHDEVITLTAASIGTTSASMGYMLTLLGLYPEWQDQVQRELDDYFGTGGDYLRPITTADLSHLNVLDAIMKESGRLFSTVPCMPYVVAEDTPLSGGRYIAPRGSTVLITYWLMHRHPALFPEPHKFDPGRFLDDGSATLGKAYSYVPFGAGLRQCIAARYAALQMKTVIATVLRRYRILPGTTREELEQSVISVISYPIAGFRVTCVPRDNLPSNSV